MPELLYNCFRDLHSRLVVLTRGEVVKTLRVVNGRPVQAESNVRSETLGALLLASGRVSEDQVRRSVALVKRGRLRQGGTLVRLGAISPEELRDALREQVRTRILDAFAWTGASYGLSYDPEVAVGIEAAEINPLRLIFEGVRSTFPVDRWSSATTSGPGSSSRPPRGWATTAPCCATTGRVSRWRSSATAPAS
ncbi:MAG: hypothetical protein R3F60_17380 [bacterium]